MTLQKFFVCHAVQSTVASAVKPHANELRDRGCHLFGITGFFYVPKACLAMFTTVFTAVFAAIFMHRLVDADCYKKMLAKRVFQLASRRMTSDLKFPEFPRYWGGLGISFLETPSNTSLKRPFRSLCPRDLFPNRPSLGERSAAKTSPAALSAAFCKKKFPASQLFKFTS